LTGELAVCAGSCGPGNLHLITITGQFWSTPSSTEPKGFTLCMVRAVMSGRGDEVIDLARTNLWRYRRLRGARL
jgi:pyruvate dehydrogenase (quinone)